MPDVLAIVSDIPATHSVYSTCDLVLTRLSYTLQTRRQITGCRSSLAARQPQPQFDAFVMTYCARTPPHGEARLNPETSGTARDEISTHPNPYKIVSPALTGFI